MAHGESCNIDCSTDRISSPSSVRTCTAGVLTADPVPPPSPPAAAAAARGFLSELSFLFDRHLSADMHRPARLHRLRAAVELDPR